MGNGYEKQLNPFRNNKYCEYSLIMLRDAAIASFTMLASQRHPNHAGNAEILLIKLPQAEQFIDNNLLLCEAAEFRYKARFIEHCAEIEVPAKSVEYAKGKVAEWI